MLSSMIFIHMVKQYTHKIVMKQKLQQMCRTFPSATDEVYANHCVLKGQCPF
jgi:hypothetical protein